MDLSENLLSDNRRDGLKKISSSVYNLLREHGSCTYKFLCSKVNNKNSNTLRRRIYDVLSVMRALNMVVKDGKEYRLQNLKDEIKEKKKVLEDLKCIKQGIECLIEKNRNMHIEEHEKFRFPFFLIAVDKSTDVHCETNDERTFFKFRATSKIKLVEDVEILKECGRKSIYGSESVRTEDIFSERYNVYEELPYDPFTFI
ncbi:transcription factor E2F [Spraguea lophii 42_110]|uniref:Transcription factor E2F n=1 Tax=Spraguea lophii (strain 42_110) TaxID=1358809 RepID=S7XSJ5_SPRLO|nr:transcription factor E2F [Spraguea lophii 42_110]